MRCRGLRLRKLRARLSLATSLRSVAVRHVAHGLGAGANYGERETKLMNTIPIIADNEGAFTDSLFNPVDGRTADGYVVKRGKKFVDVFLLGREYRVNAHRVWCKGAKTESGTFWQHAILDFPWSGSTMDDAARELI